MNNTRKLILKILLFTTLISCGQENKAPKQSLDTINMKFKDTIFNFAFDSIVNNLGKIAPTNKNNRLVKYFKYIGSKPIIITRTWTSDPHFICEYPKTPLIPNKIYSFTICFWHQDRKGKMSKMMGFDLSNGNRISLKFTGAYASIKKREKQKSNN